MSHNQARLPYPSGFNSYVRCCNFTLCCLNHVNLYFLQLESLLYFASSPDSLYKSPLLLQSHAFSSSSLTRTAGFLQRLGVPVATSGGLGISVEIWVWKWATMVVWYPQVWPFHAISMGQIWPMVSQVGVFSEPCGDDIWLLLALIHKSQVWICLDKSPYNFSFYELEYGRTFHVN